MVYSVYTSLTLNGITYHAYLQHINYKQKQQVIERNPKYNGYSLWYACKALLAQQNVQLLSQRFLQNLLQASNVS